MILEIDKIKAKEISKDLINKFLKYGLNKETSKEYSLIALSLIFDNDCCYWAYDGVTGNDIMIDLEFWEEVKEEIIAA